MEMDTLYHQAAQGGSPLEEWRSLIDTIGKRVTVSWRDDTWEGLAEDVDNSGNLLLRLDDGGLVAMTAGDVTLQGAAN
jgi:BirA family biotin operon repressor/biotin-[acetyl-CoA-carboxylase] ligase